MIRKSCPYCEAIKGVEEVNQEETIEYKAKMVSYNAIHYECSSCHNFFDSAEMMNRNLLSVKDAFDLQYNSISPNKIIEIREKYNASQKAFSLILGMGELTINSYEQGKSVPNSTNRLLIKLAENPLVFFEMYENNKSKIGAIQRERIESSEYFMDCKRWGGLENLYNNLSCSERKVIENKTYYCGESITKVISNMVKAKLNNSNFEIYKEAHEIKSGEISISDTIGFSIGVA